MKSFLSFLGLMLLAAVAQAVSSTGNRLLAVLDDVEEKSAYSKFLGDLEGRGFQITYGTPKTEGLSLFHLGERKYDHVIFFPIKSKGLGTSLSPANIIKFVNSKGNVLLALSATTTTSTSLVSTLSELDIALPADRTGLVVDHFAYDAATAAEAHDVLLLSPQGALRPDVKDLFAPDATSPKDAVIAFPRGVGHTLGSGALLAPVLRAPRTAYSYNPKEQAEVVDDLFASGSQLALVSTVQARNSARFTVLGSAEMLADTWFDATVKPASLGGKTTVPTLNRDFARKLSGWTFFETGALRVNWIEHHLNEAGAASNESNPGIYRVKNDVTYSISLSEYSWDKWVPFSVPKTDALQLEFSMLSPFHRLPLSLAAEQPKGKEAAVYTASFRLPDQHGIFNFMVNYKRPFLSVVEEKRTVSVRHMAHDEWVRSFNISAAWPWVAGVGVTVAGWLGFVAVWMYSAPVGQAGRAKKTQ